jgi:hypothetical protein
MRILSKVNLKSKNLILIMILVSSNLVVFHRYWLGISTPPWDFLGGGMVEQYRFYKDGGFFNPPSWFPYAWFGIPEYQMLQDGGWFIPVSFVAEFLGWHPANAARLQAALILFGSLGTFSLSRIFIKNNWINLFTSLSYMFIPAFYSNAQHYGVVRSASFLPWILYFCHPSTLSRGRFKIFIGAFVIFQSITGSYPGNLISTFYTVLLFILLFGLKNRSKYYLKLFFMGFCGILMGLLRYLPTFGITNSFPSTVENQAGVTFYNIIYLIFPYVGNELPWEDLTLRSLYIGPITLAAIFFYNHKILNINKWLILTLVSLVMMLENGLNEALRTLLPFADISRFAITDWRNSFNLGLILITGLILESRIRQETQYNKVRVLIFFTLYVILLFQSIKYGQSTIHLIIFSGFLFFAFITVMTLNSKIFFPHIILLATILFGTFFVYQNKFSWLTTVKEQNFNIYNNTFTNVKENTFYPLKSRPARVAFLPTPLTPENYKTDQRYNRFWLTGGFGAYGYHNIKDIKAYSALFPRLESPNDPIVNFLLAKGKQVSTNENTDVLSEINRCTTSLFCVNDLGINIKQTLFDKEKESFEINSPIKFKLIQNEMFSPVWSGKICKVDDCSLIQVEATFDSLRSWSLPSGKYTFETSADTPLNKERWILFYIGFSLSVLTIFLPTLNKKRSSSI